MAVVKGKSDLFPDTPLSSTAPDPAKARGRTRSATFTVTNLATDSSGSSYHLADVPADALWDEGTIFKVNGWGFATISIGTATDVDALYTGLISVGTYLSPVVVGDARHGLPIWQALGLAAMPDGAMVGIYAHAVAGATGAGTLTGKIVYRHH